MTLLNNPFPKKSQLTKRPLVGNEIIKTMDKSHPTANETTVDSTTPDKVVYVFNKLKSRA